MIKKLDNNCEEVANQIFTIFQSSYKVEASLIGVVDFPPLLRNKIDIKNSNTLFYGYFDNGTLAAIIEITIQNEHLEIESLTVEPKFFRKGIAGKMINYVMTTFEFTQATVETAVVNEPAINLYKKHGFVEFKKFTPDHGIQKLAMSTK